jgi:uncharacterized membrane protein
MGLTDIHPLFIHFPIALLSTGFMFDLLAIIFKKEVFQPVGWWNLSLGILSSVFAVLTGFVADWNYGHFEIPFPIFDTHGSVQLMSIFCYFVMFVWRWKLNKALPISFRSLLGYFVLGLVATSLLFYGGHLGAILAGRI